MEKLYRYYYKKAYNESTGFLLNHLTLKIKEPTIAA